MIPAKGVLEAFDYWKRTRERRPLDDLVVNFYTPKDRPGNPVVVVVGLEADQTDVGEMRDLRNRIVRICRRFNVDRSPSTRAPSTAGPSSADDAITPAKPQADGRRLTVAA